MTFVTFWHDYSHNDVTDSKTTSSLTSCQNKTVTMHNHVQMIRTTAGACQLFFVGAVQTQPRRAAVTNNNAADKDRRNGKP